MKATIRGTIIEIQKNHPYRYEIDPADGSIAKRTFAPVTVIKGYVKDHLSGETIGPLPVPYDCQVGQLVEVSVSIINAES